MAAKAAQRPNAASLHHPQESRQPGRQPWPIGDDREEEHHGAEPWQHGDGQVGYAHPGYAARDVEVEPDRRVAQADFHVGVDQYPEVHGDDGDSGGA